ncbi:MAG TPA: mitochondrial fission ELM1 family protein [Microvirga sp.]|nr:mitochondrial fission ELM1 family protein [Microvirga sp.]
MTDLWVITDGKAGDEEPCLGLAEALGLTPDIRRIAPSWPFTWLGPLAPVDPREGRGGRADPLAPPYPALAIASGRRAVPYLRALKRRSGGSTFTVFLKDPRTGPGMADLIWVPEHDALRAPNVLATLTPPHRLSAKVLAAARAAPDPRLVPLPRPRVAVLAGGDSRHYRFTDADTARFAACLERIAAGGAGLMITASRRTPEALRAALAGLVARHGGFLWDGTGANPYAAMLALADAVVATADSANMVGEAAASGAPVLVFEPSGGHIKLAATLEALKKQGIVHVFHGELTGTRYAPVDATPMIARAIAEGLARHRRASGLPEVPVSLEEPPATAPSDWP